MIVVVSTEGTASVQAFSDVKAHAIELSHSLWVLNSPAYTEQICAGRAGGTGTGSKSDAEGDPRTEGGLSGRLYPEGQCQWE